MVHFVIGASAKFKPFILDMDIAETWALAQGLAWAVGGSF